MKKELTAEQQKDLDELMKLVNTTETEVDIKKDNTGKPVGITYTPAFKERVKNLLRNRPGLRETLKLFK